MPAVTLLLLSAIKATTLIAVARVLVACLPRASAALRHAILFAAMTGALMVPLLAATLPTLTPVAAATARLSSAPELQRWRDRAVGLVIIQADAEAKVPSRPYLRTQVEQWRVAILAIWFAGAALVLARIVADLVAVHRARRRAIVRGRVRPGVPLLESADIGAPVVVGLLRPAIMVPLGTRVEAPANQPILAHELAHIERWDCLSQLVVRVVCAFYWFNPLAWRTAERIALERERACDDHALASGVDPIDYSQLLIDAARRNARLVRLHAIPLMPQAEHLEKRIVRILDASTRRGSLSRWSALAFAVAAATVVVPLAAFGVRDRPSFAEEMDLFLDPQSERVAHVPAFDPAAIPMDATAPDADLIAELRRAAVREPRSPYDLVPDRARWALSVVRDGRLVEPAIGALADPDWRVRGYAAWVLAVSRDARAVEPLLPLLSHSVWRVRAMAAVALREIGDPRAADALTASLDDPAWQVRVEAVAYFGAMRAQAFRDRIEPLRNDPHLAVRLAADDAFDRMQ